MYSKQAGVSIHIVPKQNEVNINWASFLSDKGLRR